MPAIILDGNALARSIRSEVRKQIRKMETKPGLAVVQVGNNPASTVYVSHKQSDCEKVGIQFQKHHLPEDVAQSELLALIESLNTQEAVHGILVQMPLPKIIDSQAVISAIDPQKDVDGLHSHNLGKMMLGQEDMVPGTPKGVIRLLEAYDIPFQGKKAVVVGRSILVGKPIARLMLNRHATVTLCHSRTLDLCEAALEADILIAAAGKVGLIKAEMVKPGATVVDVAINRLEDRLVGDVDFESVQAVAGAITPVPGGVGPMTRAMLLENTLLAKQLQESGA